jgi:eukaryotic-like serine/threonine-protein kinase
MAFLSLQAGTWSLRMMDLATKKERILVNTERRLGIPKLSGDGSRVAYCDSAQVAFSIPSAGGTVERLFEGCGALMDNSFDGRRILYEPLEDEHLTLFDTGLRKSVILARRPPDTVLSGSRFSPDGKWVAFHSINRSSKVRLWIARIDGVLPVPSSEWIAITDGKYVERDPAWAPGGGLLYYLSESDGFRCIWARRLDPSSKEPTGDPFPVEHFHSVRRSLAPFGNGGYLIGLSIAADRMVFSLTGLKGNLWLQEAKR